MSKKVLFIVSNAYAIVPHRRRTSNFLPEVAHPYAELDRDKCQADGNIVTGQNPAYTRGVVETTIKLLDGSPLA